jgi:hypothetical protein
MANVFRDTEKLLDFLREQGITVVHHEEYHWRHKVEGFQEAPFTSADLGICWDHFELHYRGTVPWPAVLHEAAHMLATHDKPNESKEWQFFGWEIAVVNYLRLDLEEFHWNNRDYAIDYQDAGDGNYYGEVQDIPYDSPVFHSFLASRVSFAKSCGLVAEDGTPLRVREPVLAAPAW